MQYFGDGSGTLLEVLNGHEEVFSIAVVAGPPHAVGACPKKTVRKISMIDEAKWSSLQRVSRRRVLSCMAERNETLKFSYLTLSQSDLTRIDEHYLLYDDDNLPADSDIYLKSILYSVLLDDLATASADSNTRFYFDRFASRPAWESLKSLLEERIPNIDHRHGDSKSKEGIQAADCVAGAARHDRMGESEWISKLPEAATTNVSEKAVAQIRQSLQEL